MCLCSTRILSIFNRPPPEQLTGNPFGWVYQYKHAQNDLLSDLEPLYQPINASISLTGSATLELTSVWSQMMEPLWQLLVRKELCGLVWSVKPPMHTYSLTGWMKQWMGPTTWPLTHPPLSPTIPYCVQMFHWISTTRWDLHSSRGFLACHLSHLSPTCTKELPDPEPLRRGKRRK